MIYAGFLAAQPSAGAVGSILRIPLKADLLIHLPACMVGAACEPARKGDASPMSSVVYGVLVVCAVSLAALGGLALVQRLVPTEVRQKHNDVAGFIYAVLVVVFAVWEEFDAAKDTAEQEANALAEIFWLAHGLPEPERHHVQELARSYAREVVDEEWALMEQGRASPRGWVLIDAIRATLQEVEPRTVAGRELYAEGLDQMQRLADARRMCLAEAEEGLPGVLWVVLVVGGVAAVGFTYLFGLENTQVHRLMVATLAMIIALVLFTVGALEYPFSGGARIGTGTFELVLDRFETSKLSDL